MNNPVKGILLACAAAAVVVLTLVGDPQPAEAQFGINIGGLPFRFHIGPGFGSRYGRGHSRKRGKSHDDESSKSAEESTKPGKPEKVVASKGAPSSKDQTQALKKIV